MTGLVLAAHSHGGFFTLDLRLLLYTILLSASLATGLFALKRLDAWRKRLWLWPVVFIGFLILITSVLGLVLDRPVMTLHSFFQLP